MLFLIGVFLIKKFLYSFLLFPNDISFVLLSSKVQNAIKIESLTNKSKHRHGNVLSIVKFIPRSDKRCQASLRKVGFTCKLSSAICNDWLNSKTKFNIIPFSKKCSRLSKSNVRDAKTG